MEKHTSFISRFNAWLLAKGSDRYNRKVDQRKKELFSGLSGRVLEIGPGTGSNLPYYSKDVRLIGLEPNPHMQRYLTEKAVQMNRSLEIISGRAENIPLKGESVDAVVSTLVLCSVDNVQDTLSEIKRVLKPGGSFLFIEHVAAPEKSRLRKIQRTIKPLWKCVADGCHPNRETWKMIENAGFDQLEIQHFLLSLAVVGPHILGRGKKAHSG